MLSREERVEQLAAEFHAVYQAEAERQGDVRHPTAYADLAENIKEFDRVLARHVLDALDAAEQRADQMGQVVEAWRQRAEKAEALLARCQQGWKDAEDEVFRRGDLLAQKDAEIERLRRKP